MARLKNPKLKRESTVQEFTEEMILEIDRCANDPIYFIENYIYIRGVNGRSLFKLWPYQKRMILNYLNNDRSIFVVSRQGGKSETAAAFITWYYCFHYDKSILITSYRGTNAKEIINKIVFAYEELPHWLKPGIKENNWNKLSVSFENGCTISADTTSENTGRGFAIDLLYVDELAHVADTVADEFFGSVLPTLASRVNGKMIITSTPNGDVNLFAQIWKEANIRINGPDKAGRNGFMPLFVKWNEIPGRGEEYKQKMIAQFGIRKWRQEFECEFLTSENTLIDLKDILEMEQKIQGKEVLFSIKEQVFWKQLNRKLTYIVGVDPGTGTGEDYTVIQIYEFPSMEQVSEYRTNEFGAPEVYAHLKNILRYMDHYAGDTFFSIESNGVGQGIIALYDNDADFNSNATFVSEPPTSQQASKQKLGFFTTDKSKFKTCLLLKEMLLKKNMHISSQVFISELKSFIRKKGSYDHQEGATSDCISAALICIRVMEEMAKFDDSAYFKLFSAGLQQVEEKMAENKEWDYDPNFVPDPFIFV